MEGSVVKGMLGSQFGASLAMLEKALQCCPDALLLDPARKPPLWFLVYHALFYADLYLSDSPEGFAPPRPFTLMGDFESVDGNTPAYGREELQGYLDRVRGKCRARIDELDDDGLQRACGFPWVGVSVAELFLYNMRHVQHHAGQLILVLRQSLDVGTPWITRGP